MRLLDILNEEFIIPSLKSSSKIEVLKEFCHLLGKHITSMKEDDIFKVLWEREQLCSTGVGGGIAIPHGRISNLQHPLLCFGRSTKGVNFDSADGFPVYLFFVLLSPSTNDGLYIRILAKTARLLKNGTVKEQLIKAKNKDEIISILEKNDSDF